MSQRLRIAGLLALIAGTLFVGLRFPSRPPPSWESVRAFVRDDEACETLRRSRARASFVASAELVGTADDETGGQGIGGDETGRAVTVGEVARRFDLELPLVCRANELPETGCAERPVVAGEPLLLPLGRR